MGTERFPTPRTPATARAGRWQRKTCPGSPTSYGNGPGQRGHACPGVPQDPPGEDSHQGASYGTSSAPSGEGPGMGCRANQGSSAGDTARWSNVSDRAQRSAKVHGHRPRGMIAHRQIRLSGSLPTMSSDVPLGAQPAIVVTLTDELALPTHPPSTSAFTRLRHVAPLVRFQVADGQLGQSRTDQRVRKLTDQGHFRDPERALSNRRRPSAWAGGSAAPAHRWSMVGPA